jgi:hypothetical protein
MLENTLEEDLIEEILAEDIVIPLLEDIRVDLKVLISGRGIK